jgi:short subunit dehydrogenase-like uncharacterized protein
VRIVLFGATGYTGQLTARVLARRSGDVADGATTVLAGRNGVRLAALAAELGGEVETAVADATDEGQVRDLVGPGDVLISTVGPFARLGMPAVRAAAGNGLTYLDSTGEPAFVRRVRDELGRTAARTGATLVPAFGYDYVPGNLAAELALREAPAATRVRVGYFIQGQGSASGGTSASGAGMMLDPAYAWRGGRLVGDRMASRVATFDVGGRPRQGISLAGSEHLWLPARHPGLTDVEVYLGWVGRLSRAAQVASLALRAVTAPPPGRALAHALADLVAKGSTGGPDAAARAGARTLVVAEAFAGPGRPVARVELVGPNPYELTAELLAWAATTAVVRPPRAGGVVGPVDLFGLDALEQACREMGLAPAG